MTPDPAPAAVAEPTGTLSAPQPARLPAARPPARKRSLVGAEVLRLRKRRALMVTLVALTLGVPLLIAVILVSLHAANPARFGPPGGKKKWEVLSLVLSDFGPISGILVGAFAGSADSSAGIFRLLVATGRSRASLYAARVGGLLAVFVPVIAVTVAAIGVYAVAFSDGAGEPTVSMMTRAGAWLLLECAVYALIALGFSAIVGSRSVTVGVLVAFSLIIAPLLGTPVWLSYLGLREAIFSVSLEFIRPGSLDMGVSISQIHESAGVAALSICAWVLGILGLGLWRTLRRDA